jgi:hypothetical protein
MKFFLLLILLVSSTSTWAYPHFVGHGYTSCLNCHYNPAGNGPLTDYGRAISATLIASGALYPETMTEEKVAYTSGFFFRKPVQNYVRTQVNYRGLQLVRNPGSTSSETKQWINMQADASLVMKSPSDRFVAVINYGYSPKPRGQDKEMDEWRSREHYMGYRFTPKFGLYAGLMDKAYGLRVIEHTMVNRTTPQVTQNDQVHGLKAHYLGEKFETFLHGFVGNMSQDEDVRMKGGSFMFERSVSDIHRLGASVMHSQNEYTKLLSYAAHGRWNLKEGSALLAEFGQTKRTADASFFDKTTRYGILQTYLRPIRGVYFFTNIEYYQDNIEKESYFVRWGPGVQYFPINRLELRGEVLNTRNFSPDSSSKDSWMYLLQAHVWL